jgi:hypothetical protein
MYIYHEFFKLCLQYSLFLSKADQLAIRVCHWKLYTCVAYKKNNLIEEKELKEIKAITWHEYLVVNTFLLIERTERRKWPARSG